MDRRVHRVLLVGFMGAGKTTVGKDLARRLGWRFVDFDDEVEAAAGMPVPEIFETRSEARFRELEADVAHRLLEEEEVVLGSGGGWAAHPGRLDAVPTGTATFWLQVSARRAVDRVEASGGVRPLLEVRDPEKSAMELLSKRVAYYQRAQWTVDTEHSSVEDVSAQILEILAREYPEQRLDER